MNALDLLRELIAIPGPPGQEAAVAEAVAHHVHALGYRSTVDAKGNLIVKLGNAKKPNIVVTAHLDEIAMLVRGIGPEGEVAVTALGGLFPWKIGEGTVEILVGDKRIPGILSFGSIHTEDPTSTVRQADGSGLEWEMAKVVTGMSWDESVTAGIRPGRRCVVATSRRGLTELANGLVAGHFLDDRADLVSWLLALERLKGRECNCWFVATAAEEVGGEGALFLLQDIRPDVVIALELGPNVPDAPVELCEIPTLWMNDGYSAMSAADGDLVASIADAIGVGVQYQALSRGGSDASCAAHHGLCARPITLGLPMDNSHGFEIMHGDAMEALASLTAALVAELA